MSRLWRSLPAAGIAAVGLYVTTVACKDDGPGDDGNVELQVLAGIANAPVTGYIVRVNTPGGEFEAPLGSGDQTNPANWATFDLFLEENEMLVISVMEGDNPLVIGECTVNGATELGYARAVAFYFAPPNNYINCGTGFIPAP